MTAAFPPLAEALLRPRSVALVGVSAKPASPAGRPLRFLRQSGYAGRVYPVRSGVEEIQGERCWPSLDALPETPDHAFLLGAADTVLDQLARCVARGVPVVSILASGFAEAGEEGAALQERVLDSVRGSSTRVLGPSTLGVANFHDGIRLTANAALEGEFPAGKVLAVSHSGSLLGALASRAKARGVGYGCIVSVGSEVDLSMAEICRATLDDPRVEGFVLFLEHLEHAAALREFAAEAHARGKPVVAYKLGRTRQAARLAATHTGAIVGDDDLADAFLNDSGIVRVHHIDGLLPAALLAQQLQRHSDLRPFRVGVISTTGGGASMLVDELGLRRLPVTAPSTACVEALAVAGVSCAGSDIVDLTLAGTRPEVMRRALGCVVDPGAFDLVVVVLGSSAATRPQESTAPVIESARETRCPLAVLVLPDAPEALSLLAQQGIAAFSAPELCADAVAAIAKADARRRMPADHVASRKLVRSRADAANLEAIGVGCVPELLVALDGPVPVNLPFDYPLAVKASSADIAHKTELGAAILGVQDAAQLEIAFRELQDKVDGHACATAQIQPMVRDGIAEVLIGFLRDPEVGPVVTLAPGGVLAELSTQRSVRLAPVDPDEAMRMIEELETMRVLRGYRGRPLGDVDAAAHAIHKLSLLALQDDVQEAEINPLIVRAEGQGAVAVDFIFGLR